MGSRPTSSRFPGFDHVYWLTEPGTSRAFRANLELADRHQAFAITRGEAHINKPIKATWFMGMEEPADIIRTGYIAPILVNERVLTLLRDIRASGWGTYEVQLFDKRGERLAGYYGLSVHGRCGPIDTERSAKVYRRFPGGVFPMWRGLYFDPEEWDGSEIFMPAGRSSWVLVVESVRDAFREAKVSNVRFENLRSIERSAEEMDVSMYP